MFLTVLKFELAFWFRRPLTLLFFVVFFLMAFFSTASDTFLNVGGTGQVHRNAPYLLATVMGILTALGQVITTAIAGTAVLRDAQLGTQELLFTTRLSRSGYLLGRFLGAFAVMVVIYTAMPIGLLLGTLMPWVPADKLGPVSLWAAIQPFLVIAVPNLFFVSALLFAIGALTRKLFAVYVTGIVLLVGWQVTQQVTSNLDRLSLAALIDPFAITTVSVVTRYWSTAEKNTLLLPLGSVVWQNRALWIGLGSLIFAAVAMVFRLRLSAGTSGRRVKRAPEAPAKAGPIPVVALRYDGAAWWGVLASQFRLHFRSIVREAPFQAILAIGLVNTGMGLWYTSHPGDSAHWPTTSEYAPVLPGSLGLFIVILATLYGGELIWRERQMKADQISDAMPVPAWVPYGGKFLAVVAALCVVPSAAALLGMAMQLAQGYTHLQPGLYAEVVVAGVLPNIICFTAMAMGIHAVVNQKFVGHLLIIVYWLSLGVLANFGFDHVLYQLGAASFTYSDLNGWGPFPAMLLVLDWYSIAACLLIGTLGYLVLVRGTVAGWTPRWREAAARWRSGGAAVAAGLGAATIALGGVTFYNTNVLNHYTTVRVAEADAKAWELEYKPLAKLAEPRIIGVSLHHDLYPARRTAAWWGTIRAVNRHDVPVDTLFINVPPTAARPASRTSATTGVGNIVDSLVFSRPVTLLRDDTPRGVRLYRLLTPMQPGDSLTMRFAGRYESRGFSNGGFNNDFAANGSFMSSSYYPGFGYQESAELAGDDVRKRNGLQPRPRMRAIDDPAMRQNNYITSDADWIAFDETTCTSPDQIAIAPGYLDREWTEGGRRCFHYQMDRPILDFYTTLSARYTVTKERYKGISLEIYHLPEHDRALPSMMQASKDGLDYFDANFSPYLYRQYRIIEFPRYQSFAQSFPNTIPYSEAIGFINRKEEGDDKMDFSYFVTAHELAHQWWAHQVVGGNGQGSTLFSEGLAEYSALTVMEKRYGREAAQKFLRRELDGYLRGRANEQKKELPALLVENQPYIHYQKGSLVFYALRDYIGEAAMNTALRAFLAKWALKGPPYPNARDLLAEFRAVTPDSLQYVLRDLFEEITFYENRADTATATARPDGRYDVHLALHAVKLKGDSLGNTHEVPVDDYIDVGIFGEHVAGQKLGARLLVQKVHITGPETRLDFVVDKEPLKAGIDPYNKLIDRTPEDNVMAVTLAKGTGKR